MSFFTKQIMLARGFGPKAREARLRWLRREYLGRRTLRVVEVAGRRTGGRKEEI